MKSSSRTRRFGDLTCPILETHFVMKNTTFGAPAISQNVTKCCACHEKSHSNFTKYCACHAKCISWLIASHMKRHLECAEQAKSTSNLSKYCACHAKWISWLIRASYETSFPMRRASKVNLQPQQILRLPRKMNPMINPRHTWNVIYNARSMHSQPPTSPNTAPATKSVSSRLQRKLRELLPPIERRFDDNPTIIRRQSDQKIASRTRRFGDLTRPTLNTILYWKIQHFALRLSPKMSPNAAPATKSHTPTSPNTAPATQKCISWLIRVTYETSFRMRGASKVNLEPQQILRLPRKMNLMIDPRLIWNVISNAQSKQSQPPTSANTAPATQNESHDLSASHMKRHLQCAEHAQSATNLTKYCACHEICKFKTSAETPWIASANRKTIRRQSDDNPTMIRAWNRHLAPAASETLLVRPRTRSCIEKYNISRSGYLPKCHQMLRLPRKVTLQLHQILRLPRKNASHDWSASHMKRHLECAEQAKSTSNLSKYCACHAKWISWLIRASYETSFPMRRASKVNLQPQQILRLPRKMNPMINPRHTWNVIYNARSMHSQPPTSPNTAPATKSASSRLQRKLRELLPPIERRFDDNPTTIRPWSEHEIVISHPPLRRPYSSDLEHDLVLKNTTFRAPAISQNVTKCCACHEKSHSNFTKYCAWHEKCNLLFSILYSLLASILSWHLFSLGIYSLLASILSWDLFSLGIYSLLASILSWHLFSLGIYSLLASIL